MWKTRGEYVGEIEVNDSRQVIDWFSGSRNSAGFVSGYALVQIHSMSGKANEVDQTWMPSVSLLGKMNGDISDVERLALGIIVEQNEDESAKMNEALQLLLTKIEDERKQLQTLIANNDAALKLYNDFSTNYDAYVAKMPAFIEFGLNNNYDESSRLHTEAYPMWYTANDSITKLINLGNEGSDAATNESVLLAENTFNVILAVTIFAFLVAMFIAFFIASIISRPIKR